MIGKKRYVDRAALGALLVAAEIIDEKAIDACLIVAQHGGLPLGRVLLMDGHLDAVRLSEALELQALVRTRRLRQENAVRALRITHMGKLPLAKALERIGFGSVLDSGPPTVFRSYMPARNFVQALFISAALLVGSKALAFPCDNNNHRPVRSTAVAVCASKSASASKSAPASISASASASSSNSSQSPDFNTRKLSEAPDLPDVPRYTGKTAFITGVELPNAPGGNVVTLIFSAKEDGQTILAWYADSLTSYRWTLDKQSSNPSRVVAVSKDGNVISITVSAAAKSSDKSTLTLYFRGIKSAS